MRRPESLILSRHRNSVSAMIMVIYGARLNNMWLPKISIMERALIARRQYATEQLRPGNCSATAT